MSLVLFETRNGVATLTLNRPDKLNALTTASFRELRAHLDAIASDASIRCVVLAGAGRSFCAGHDLADLADGEAFKDRHFEAETIDRLESLPMPTIGRLHGHCLTGGLELALGCDILIAADDTKLGDTHGKWGVVPIWGLSVRLPERVGIGTAKSLMFTSRILDGKAAQEIGLVDVVVPAAELDAAVQRMADDIVRNSAGSNRIVKTLLRDNSSRSRVDALGHERAMPYGMAEDMAERLASAPRKI
jgi:enoyl-CoA hydratase